MAHASRKDTDNPLATFGSKIRPFLEHESLTWGVQHSRAHEDSNYPLAAAAKATSPPARHTLMTPRSSRGSHRFRRPDVPNITIPRLSGRTLRYEYP
jgi:hypothetical protein